MRFFGISLILATLLSAWAKQARLEIPVLHLFDWFDRPFRNEGWNLGLGDIFRLISLFLGVWAVRHGPIRWNPLTLRKWQRFKSIRRGYVAALTLGALVVLSCLDGLLVGKQALVVSYGGKLCFPFVQAPHRKSDFGQSGAGEPDYRDLKKIFEREDKGDWVILPFIPYGSKLDAPIRRETVEVRPDGKAYSVGADRPFTGNAYLPYQNSTETRRFDFKYIQGLREGPAQGYDKEGNVIERLTFEKGHEKERKVLAEVDFKALDAAAATTLTRNVYPPNSPSWTDSHYLGTDSGGNDVLALLFGGFQLLVFASAFYLVVTFAIGITLGCLLGFLGGAFDMVVQRLTEIWISLPFLYVVIFLRGSFEPRITIIISLLALFGWMQATIYMRASTYKEKARDYVAAGRVLGASSPRIIFVHIVPNVISTLVTLVPFKIAGVIASLSALDYLGFGLPPGEPSLGALLKDGSENMSYPWIIMAATVAMVALLVLVTFVGEAVREAFDPKKHTTYS